ncbi:MAG: hypothetical protein HN952_02975 [Candidatus Cloacimonetes bacterium]|jgi:hypothetical protein|nr:hypothetical protein [Candidatus Cloacimonadota bacterium]MBT6993898.1 hypothetical protein [Candidatus Cloacimonadota bacterium]
MKDFTFHIYEKLLTSFLQNHYEFHTLEKFHNHQITKSLNQQIVMRHDVDRKPQNALQMAKLENKLGIRATYYFRIVKASFDEKIIQEIALMGHEIGYHYENLSIAQILTKKTKPHKEELFEIAIKDFEENLRIFRQIYPVKTICMHGRPLSKWDNRELWKKYNYHDFGVTCEPYFDFDFNEVFYVTDASRCWNNETVNRRDKVETKFKFKVESTNDLIELLDKKELPKKMIINIHPEHWAENNIEWFKIWIIRKLKNFIKKKVIRGKK